MIQAVLVVVFAGALQRVVFQATPRPDAAPDTAFVFLVGEPNDLPMPPRIGSRQPPSAPASDVTVTARDTGAADGVGIAGPIVPGPALGDGSLWVTARPALPAVVADQLYAEAPASRDSIAIRRLRAMVDSLNALLDEEQRARRLPDWTVGGGDSPTWGIDSRWIHLGDIKIPTAVLALIGGLLPQGNYGESVRSRQLGEMRQDLLQSAWRAQTFQDFQRYVRETRERRQKERDAEERRHAPADTTGIVP